MGTWSLLCFASLSLHVVTACKYRVCYYTNWAQYRRSPARYVPENIDPALCTHLIYAFAVLQNHKLKAFEWNDDDMDWAPGMYTRFNKLKQKNPALRTLLAVGGWTFGSEPFSKMCASQYTRKIFIDHAITFLRDRNFDGLDLDWEYPVARGGSPSDKRTFTYLVQELMAAFTAEAKRTGKPRLLLTAALAAGKKTIDESYEVDKIANQLDIVGLMTYDYHGAWDEYAGHNSPLYSFKNFPEDVLYIKYTVDYYLSLGLPKNKLVIGISTYGRSVMLKDMNNNQPDAPIRGAGPQGPYTGSEGFLAYYEYCKTVQTAKVGRAGGVPYAVYDNGMWLGYDDVQSVTDKINYLRRHDLAGYMVWTIDFDDFTGNLCGDQQKYPMIKAANTACQQTVEAKDKGKDPDMMKPEEKPKKQNVDPPSSDAKPNVALPPSDSSPPKVNTGGSPPQTANDPKSLCTNFEGIRDYPGQCGKYLQCTTYQAFVSSCPPGLVFNKKVLACDWKANVPEC